MIQLATLLLLSPPSLQTGSAEDGTRARLAAAIAEEREARGIAGIAVAIVRDGEVAWADGHGFADVERQRPVTPDTVFNAGSISKAVSAWVVMRLVERGVLDLDEPVESYLTRWRFPESPHDASGITARRLLSHTAGLSMHSIPGFAVPAELPPLEAILSGDYANSMYTAGGTPLEQLTAPGTEWRYSGGGFVLLELLVEELTLEPFADVAQREVLHPLGMTGSRFGWSDELAERAALPYRSESERHATFRFTGAAGAGLYTTVTDLARFAAAGLASDDAEPGRGVLEPATVASMFEPARLADGSAVRCGLAYFLAPEGVRPREANHSGSNNGWQAVMVSLPDRRSAVAILTNSDSASPILSRLVCLWGELEAEATLSGCR